MIYYYDDDNDDNENWMALDNIHIKTNQLETNVHSKIEPIILK